MTEVVSITSGLDNNNKMLSWLCGCVESSRTSPDGLVDLWGCDKSRKTDTKRLKKVQFGSCAVDWPLAPCGNYKFHVSATASFIWAQSTFETLR